LIKLNRIQCFLFGLGIICLFYVLNRSRYIVNADRVEGKFVFYVSENDTTDGALVYPVIEYEVKDSAYRFKGREGSAFELNEHVPVLLEDHDPNRPMLFTTGSFWLYPLFYIILPVLIWAAFSLSYIQKNEKVLINMKYPFFRKEKGSIELRKRQFE
jgi:hypothetical protein